MDAALHIANTAVAERVAAGAWVSGPVIGTYNRSIMVTLAVPPPSQIVSRP